MRPVESYCGPAAVASALGITRTEAAERLLKIRPRSRGRFNWEHLAMVVGIARPIASPRTISYPYDDRPSLAKWLKEDGRDAIIFVSAHFVHVRGGVVVEDNGYPARRGLVKAVILLRTNR